MQILPANINQARITGHTDLPQMKRLNTILLNGVLLMAIFWPRLNGEHAVAAAENPVNARIGRLRISGNKAFSQNKVKSWLGLKKDTLISERLFRDRGSALLQRYHEHGYYFARYDSLLLHYSEDSTRVDVDIYLNEGEKVKVEKFEITGIDSFRGDWLGDLESQPGRVFSPARLEEDIETIIQHFERNGHPYCRVFVSKMALSEKAPGAEIVLTVEPGQKLVIREIAILGNQVTKDFVILRELSIQPGVVYDQKKIDSIQPRLMKLGYFKWVNPARVEVLEDGTGRLIVELAEGSHNRFDGVLGYNPSTQTSDGFVTGLLDFKFGNLFGTGREVDAHWARRTEETQNFRFGYTEPWVAGFSLNIGFQFEQLIQDTTYIQRDLRLNFDYLLSDSWTLFTVAKRQEVSPDSVGEVRFGIPRSTSVSLAVGSTFDTRDDLLNPTRGFRYRTSFEWRRKDIDNDFVLEGDEDSFGQTRITIDFENYFSLFRWQVFYLALHGREVTSDEKVVSITDQYRLGGAKTLRGYREEQFRGSRLAWTNFEYRLLLGRRSRFFAFVDVGYYFREEKLPDNDIDEVDDVKIGYGFGVRLDTRLGFFGIDFGLGEGDSFSDAKVHIGLTNEF